MNLNNAELVISAGYESQFPAENIPHIVLSGRSNVGKSSLINKLLNRKSLARVSSAPGKTVTVNFYRVDGKLMLVDLPGYGYAKRGGEEREKWSSVTDSYLQRSERIALVLQLVDLRQGITENDAVMLDWLGMTGVPFAVIGTKADKLNKTDLKRSLETICNDPLVGAAPVIPFSSLKGTGRDEVLKLITTHIGV